MMRNLMRLSILVGIFVFGFACGLIGDGFTYSDRPKTIKDILNTAERVPTFEFDGLFRKLPQKEYRFSPFMGSSDAADFDLDEWVKALKAEKLEAMIEKKLEALKTEVKRLTRLVTELLPLKKYEPELRELQRRRELKAQRAKRRAERREARLARKRKRKELEAERERQRARDADRYQWERCRTKFDIRTKCMIP